MEQWKACIFDLDGVIVHTSHYHFLAWRRLAAEFEYQLTEQDNDQLKGLSRLESINLIAEMANVTLSDTAKEKWMIAKNEWYLRSVRDLKPGDALPGVRAFIEELRARDIKIGLGSASRNAELVLQLLDMSDLFDVRVDGTHTTKSKPDPEVFLKGAEALHVNPAQTIVFEDSIAGVEAANEGGFYSIGVGDIAELHLAKKVIPDFKHMTVEYLKELIS